MEKETFNEIIEISYSGDFAVANTTKPEDYSVEKSLQLLSYMKGKGFDFIGISLNGAYFKKENKKNKRK